eukprot:4646058-Pyramimonas_sp.AAC.1
MAPVAVDSSGRPQMLGCRLFEADVLVTCDDGKSSPIGYDVVRQGWSRARCGGTCSLASACGPNMIGAWRLGAPGAQKSGNPSPPSPGRTSRMQPVHDSQSSERKAAAKERRRHALSEHLQEEFH